MKMHVSELTPEEFQETFPNIKAKPEFVKEVSQKARNYYCSRYKLEE